MTHTARSTLSRRGFVGSASGLLLSCAIPAARAAEMRGAGGDFMAYLRDGTVRPVLWTVGEKMVPRALGSGTRLGNGCTSGHAIFGISNLEAGSVVSTVIFMASGIVTANLIYRVIA